MYDYLEDTFYKHQFVFRIGYNTQQRPLKMMGKKEKFN